MPKTKFVIIANPRTGTNHFIDLLNSHPDIQCHSELFHQHTVYLANSAREDLLEERNRNPLEFMEKIYKSSHMLACGFKIFDGHNSIVLNKVIQDTEIKKIVLYRPNYLAVYSSERIAELEKCYVLTGIEAYKSDANISTSGKTTHKAFFDHETFQQGLVEYQNHYRYVVDQLNNSQQEYLFVTYEDYINESFFRRVFSYLGLSQPMNICSKTVKLNTSDILSRFINPDDAKTYVEKIGKHNWIYEGFMNWSDKFD